MLRLRQSSFVSAHRARLNANLGEETTIKKTVLAAILSITLLSALFVAPGGDSVEVGGSADVVAELPQLGPVELIMNQYNAGQQAACTSTGALFPSACFVVPASVPGFNITPLTSASCSSTGGWTLPLSVCTPFLFAALTSKPLSQNDPCAGTVFAVVTLTNPNMDTLVINITGNGTGPCGL
ncbi:hypothetical protein JYT71_00765 [Acidimicrobiaceae bacterium AH-315-P05]|nr:hypothetical protein [Acidimicrobiaceae bacterium AH-315-P05]